ncbi:MAG: hypothetical protein KDA87_19035, partial [Planctomycetales bacterium]|nr:hypothetical protein [Planctomycetales bacterium]
PALEQSFSQDLMVHSLDRLADSDLVAVGAWSHFIRIWDLAKEPGSLPKLEIPTDARMTRGIKHLPTRNSILTIDHRGVCREYSLETSACVWKYSLYDQQNSERVQYDAKVLSERDRCVVFGGSPSHGHIAVFDLNSMDLIVSNSDLPGHVSADVLQNGRMIVGYQNSANIEILNVDDLTKVSGFELPGDGVECVCVSPDKTKCAFNTVRRGEVSDFCDLSLWNLSDHKVQEHVGIEGRPFRSIEFSPDGYLIATGQQSSGVVCLIPTCYCCASIRLIRCR